MNAGLASAAPTRETGFEVSSLRMRLKQHLGETLAELEDDVADEAVADDDIHLAGVDVAALDVADEVEAEGRRGGLDQLMRLLRQLVALGLFFAVGEQADAGMLYAEDAAHVGVAHDGELEQIGRLAVGVGAHVEHQRVASARRWNDAAERWAIHTLDAAEREDRGGQDGATVAGGDGGDRPAIADELMRHRDAVTRLGAHRLGRDARPCQ